MGRNGPKLVEAQYPQKTKASSKAYEGIFIFFAVFLQKFPKS